MKKINYIGVALLAVLSACSDEEIENQPVNVNKYEVTATIRAVEPSTRMLDADLRNTFQAGDEILIGWQGSDTYHYTYDNGTGKFKGKVEEGSIWTVLSGLSSPTVDIYSWYGTTPEDKLPLPGATLSVSADQSSNNSFLSSLYMAAHQRIAPSDASLNFVFSQLMARVTLTVSIIDPLVEQMDVMNAKACLMDMRTNSKLGIDADANYMLKVPDIETRQDLKMCSTWSDQQAFSIQFKCLFPPQTLDKYKKIVITLGNGKEYVCRLSKEITLKGGQNATITASLKASEDAVLKPVITKVENVFMSAYSGNRIFAQIENNDGTYSYRIFEKQADGSWSNGEIVYNDEAGTTELPDGKSATKTRPLSSIELCGDYGVLGFGKNNSDTYFIKKSKTTGKWFCAAGPMPYKGYAVAISDNFLISGDNYSNSYIYPIDKEGNITSGKSFPIGGYKLSLTDNVVAGSAGVFQYNVVTDKWDKIISYPLGAQESRAATDGKKVILQQTSGVVNVRIYDIKTRKEEPWEGDRAKASCGRPVAIYGDYALTCVRPEDNNSYGYIDICYRNPETGKWKIVNPQDGHFFDLIKAWNPAIDLKTNISNSLGEVFLKGYRALITWDGNSYFIENLDEMVQNWMKEHPE